MARGASRDLQHRHMALLVPVVWAAPEAAREPSVAWDGDLYHVPCGKHLCFPPRAITGATSLAFAVRGAAGQLLAASWQGFSLP